MKVKTMKEIKRRNNKDVGRKGEGEEGKLREIK